MPSGSWQTFDSAGAMLQRMSGDTAGGDLTGTYPNPTVAAAESWKEIGASGQPAFENSWVNYGAGLATAAFYKDHQGRVYLKGIIKNGTTSATAFTMPSGYRPAEYQIFAVLSNNAIGRMDINTSGAVNPVAGVGSNAWVTLDGISWRAA